MSGMWLGSILGLILLLGFAYIIWVLAGKEKGNIKLIGQIVALVIVVIAVVLLLSSLFWGGGLCGGRGYGMMGGGMMGHGGASLGSQKKMQMYMDKMMQNPEMKKYLQGKMKDQ